MADIVLAAVNAKYIHASFGLRYLLANMGENAARSVLLEFDINMRPADVAERILSANPRIIGLGVYIWNATQALALARILKSVRPDVTLVLGGPEVSYETETQEITRVADYVVCGEADLAFPQLCREMLCGRRPEAKIVRPELPALDRIELPYDLYAPADLEHRVVYVEASRGCPFSCEFCLSSVDIPVRQIAREKLLPALESLLNRGARQLKFVDRTFNLNVRESLSVLEFLLARYQPRHFFHFEVVPDRLPAELRDAIALFPAGALQLEAGVQTFNEEVAARISRRQNYAALEENLRFLRTETGAHIHADLIAGLPGEDLDSFAAGFDRLVGLQPHEIQLGILKRLKGTPISRHDAEWEMVYCTEPPYEILQNKLLRFEEIQRLKRFARYWDLVANSGNFNRAAPMIWGQPGTRGAFEEFMRFSEWVYARTRKTDSIALSRLMEAVHDYLTGELGVAPQTSASALWSDYCKPGRREKPEFLRGFALPDLERTPPGSTLLPKRQARRATP